MNNQLKRINFNHSFIFFLSCNILSLFFLSIDKFTILPLICLFLIFSIGVSHGSLDHLKGKKLIKILKIENILVFYLIYMSIALTVIVLWTITPSISLVIFLVVAAYHFGKEDTQFLVIENSFLIQFLFFFKGTLVILAPLYFHFDETISIFKLLLVDNENFYKSLSFIETNKILLIGVILSTFSSVILFANKFEIKKFTIFFDFFSILILNYYFSPLLAFTVYFCFLHSVRHIITLMSELDEKNLSNGFIIFLNKALPLTILTAFFCFIGLYLLNNTYDFTNSILKVIFIGLASLTFPHILLEYLIEKNEK